MDVNASLSRVRRVQCSPSRGPQPPRAGAVHGPVELCLSAGLWTSQSIIPQLKKPCSPESTAVSTDFFFVFVERARVRDT